MSVLCRYPLLGGTKEIGRVVLVGIEDDVGVKVGLELLDDTCLLSLQGSKVAIRVISGGEQPLEIGDSVRIVTREG